MPKPDKELQTYDDYKNAAAKDMRQRLSAPSSNTIKTKGKIFTLPDGTTNAGPLNVIIVAFIRHNLYYGTAAYDAGNPSPPVCYSLDRITENMAPSPHSESPQSEKCETCPQNEWGSSPTSRGKACQNRVKLAIIQPNIEKPTAKDMMIISVSSTGLKPFDTHVMNLLEQDNTPLLGVVTSIRFDPNQSYPSLQFAINTDNQYAAGAFALMAQADALLARDNAPS